jgi:type II secretory pathway component PulJ
MERHMSRARPGTTLAETLIALLLVALGAAWTLHATTAAQRAIGQSNARFAALNRAGLALAQLQTLSCDSASSTRTATEPRWTIAASHTLVGHAYHDAVVLRSRLGDTIRVARHGWCD